MPDWARWILEELQDLDWWEILAISLVAAIVIQFVIARVVLALTRKTKTTLDDDAVSALRKPLFVTVLAIGIDLAMKSAGLSYGTVELVGRLTATVAILLWMKAFMRIGDAVLDALARRADDFRWIEPRSLPLYEIGAKLGIVGCAAYALMLTWEIDVTAWLASAGILGIAIGFAAKDTLANLFAGMFILADAPYKIGDFIVLGSGERGMVTDIGIRSTRLLTRDDIEITLPNAIMANAKIVNESSGPHVKRRLRIDVGVAYGSDIDRVREVLMEIAGESEHFLDDPAPRVRFRALGESSLDFQLMGWIDHPVLRGRATDQLLGAIYKRFAAEGIGIPFPQRDVHLHTVS
jgi:MscS family membrane protein